MPFSHWSVRAKLLSQIGLFAVGLSIFAAVAFWTIGSVRINGPLYNNIIQGKDLVADILPPPEYIIESYLVALQLDSETDATQIRILADRLGELESEYADRHEYWVGNLSTGQMKTTMTRTAYEPAMQFYRLCADQFIPAKKAGQHELAHQVIRDQLRPLYQQHRQAIDQVVEMANQQNSDLEAQAASTLRTSRAFLWTFALCILGVTAAVGWLVSRNLINRIGVIIARLKDIAEGEGDLTARIDVSSQDELGQLSLWFNRFIGKVHDAIADLAATASQVALGASGIAAGSLEMEAGVNAQSSQISEITEAIRQMSQAILEVAQKSAQASQEATLCGKSAGEGQTVVRQTISGMEDIHSAASSTTQTVQQLGAHGEQIGNIIKVINDIADQTNLLALNAAIEAARAGDQGRGFAVVADEVRRLADRTTAATEEIVQSIRTMQQQTQQVIQSMDANAAQITTGMQSADTAGDRLGDIVNSAANVEEMIRAIAASIEEQSATSEVISQNVQSISSSAAQISEGTAQSVSVANELSERSERLQALVNRFRINTRAA